MNKHLYKILAFMLVFVMLFAIGCGDSGSSKPPVSEDDWTDLSVREATGANGVVASASAYASKAGLTVLEAGSLYLTSVIASLEIAALASS